MKRRRDMWLLQSVTFMKKREVLGACGVAVTLALAISCNTSSQRSFDDASDGAAGDAALGAGAGAGKPNGGGGGSGSSAGGATTVAGTGAASGAGSAGGEAGAESRGGMGGSLRGNEAGAGGETSEPVCPKNSCCLASGTVERDEVDPNNVCQSCQPHRSTGDWSDRNGELCKEAVAEVFSPSQVRHQSQSCGEGGCGDPYFTEPDAEQMLVITPTIPLDRLHLDFSNLRASVSLNVSKAVVRFSVKAVAATQPVKVIVSGVADPVCSYPISSKNYSNVTCDVTNAVKAWMQAPASTERTIAIGTQNVGNPLMVQSHEAADAAVRPVLLLDYAASCEGYKCVTIAREP